MALLARDTLPNSYVNITKREGDSKQQILRCKLNCG